ncbi:Protein-L-isoaspartate(D-aspartate) O-methyltransferase, partial [mine drainage metagenome]
PPGLPVLDFQADTARRQMIEQQIRAVGVLTPQTLAIFRDVPREDFVPVAYRTLAFADCEIPIGYGESMLSPQIEAQCLDALDVRSTDQILEIGTGSGFLTACLARLGCGVITLDLHADFVDQARLRHQHLTGLAPIDYRVEDGHRLPDSLREERFDVIVLTGSLYVPEPSFHQALTPGGRLWVVTGMGPIQEAHRIVRVGQSAYDDRVLFETRLKPLTHAPRPSGFRFA